MPRLNLLERFIQRAPEATEELEQQLRAQAKKELDPHLQDLLLRMDELLDDFFEVGFFQIIGAPIEYGRWEDAIIVDQVNRILDKKTLLEKMPPRRAIRRILTNKLPPDHNYHQVVKAKLEKILDTLNELRLYLAEKRPNDANVALVCTWQEICTQIYKERFFNGGSLIDDHEQLRT